MWRLTVDESERMAELYFEMWTLVQEDDVNMNRAIVIGQEMEEIRSRYNFNMLDLAYTYHNNVWLDHSVVQKYLDCDCWFVSELFYLDPEVYESDKVYLRMKWRLNA